MMPVSEALIAGAVLVTVAILLVWRRRSTTTIVSLLAVLLGAVLWSVCYALELSAGDLVGREYWGDLKYVGVCLLPAAYLAFVLQCSGHIRWPRWAGPTLAVEPLAVLLLLANQGTHDLIRYYPPDATAATSQAAEAGPLFWPHLLYNNALVWTATALLVVTLSRMSGLYRRQSVLLVAAILLPILLNLLFNVRVEPFRQVGNRRTRHPTAVSAGSSPTSGRPRARRRSRSSSTASTPSCTWPVNPVCRPPGERRSPPTSSATSSRRSGCGRPPRSRACGAWCTRRAHPCTAPRTGRRWSSSGNGGPGGTLRYAKKPPSSRGALEMKSR